MKAQTNDRRFCYAFERFGQVGLHLRQVAFAAKPDIEKNGGAGARSGNRKSRMR
jgi:hypothetical protein